MVGEGRVLPRERACTRGHHGNEVVDEGDVLLSPLEAEVVDLIPENDLGVHDAGFADSS